MKIQLHQRKPWLSQGASLSLLLGLLTVPAQAAVPTPLESVNPLIGTDAHGHLYPGATVPFGMVQLSPDTPKPGWDGCSGYHYSDDVIRGFSHTHLSGTGVGGLGDILLMPTVGDLQLNEGSPGNGYASHFSHAQEKASPGYYRVFLDTPQVTAELTATARTGLHKYTFPATDNAHIVLDLVHGVGGNPVSESLNIENSTALSGSRVCNDWGGRREIFFAMQFSKPFASYGIEQDGQRLGPDSHAASGKSVKAFFNYQTRANEAILVKVGISGTSIDGARKNLAAENPGWNFEAVRAAAERQWSKVLDQAQIATPDPKIRTTFYTNLYETCLAPTLFNDVDGRYRGLDRKNHEAVGFQNYTTFSLWDIFRAEQPLLTLFEPERVSDMVNSLFAHYKDFGRHTMPVWPMWGNETWCMIGYHSVPVVVDAYLKGFRGFDAEATYQALRDTAMQDRDGLDEYRKQGYVTSAGQKQSVSRTLEYAYDDWCIAQMAQALGHTDDAKLFFQRAGNYRNLFDTNTGFMRGRKATGAWRHPFNPKQLVWDDYTEANAWQYSWSVMQDGPDLVRIMGGDGPFTQKLDSLFTESSDILSGVPDITGLIGQYAHGNEPVHHVAYLYNYAGVPSKTQQRVRQVMTTLYDDTPAGQPGNDDCGQMSAWYVFSALGFYPVNPASGVYVIGSPLVNKATLTLDKAHYGGHKFTVIADNNSPRNIYIQSATLNGAPLRRSWITHRELAAGGELHFKMGPTPNLKWGQAPADRPASGMPADFKYAALPAPSSNVVNLVTLPLPIRIAAGASEPVQGFVPAPEDNVTDGSSNGDNPTIDTSAAGAAPAAVYQHEMYGSDFTIKLPVPKTGHYNVRLHFAELFTPGTGQRIENVQLNGQTVLSNFDIFTAAGGLNKAVVKDFRDIAPDAAGNIVIHITSAPNSPDSNAKISGVEITVMP